MNFFWEFSRNFFKKIALKFCKLKLWPFDTIKKPIFFFDTYSVIKYLFPIPIVYVSLPIATVVVVSPSCKFNPDTSMVC